MFVFHFWIFCLFVFEGAQVLIYYLGFPMQEMKIVKSAIQTMNTKYCQSLCNQYHVQLLYILVSAAIDKFLNTYITYAYRFSSGY